MNLQSRYNRTPLPVRGCAVRYGPVLASSDPSLMPSMARSRRRPGAGLSKRRTSMSSWAGGLMVLLNQPVASVYWAASGEVYLNTKGSHYEIIAFTEGDALGPLRFRYASKRALCDEATCQYETVEGLNVVLQTAQVEEVGCHPEAIGQRGQAAAVLILDATENSGGEFCSGRISWGEVQQRGGVEVRFRNGKITRRHARKCSKRPWRQCREL